MSYAMWAQCLAGRLSSGRIQRDDGVLSGAGERMRFTMRFRPASLATAFM